MILTARKISAAIVCTVVASAVPGCSLCKGGGGPGAARCNGDQPGSLARQHTPTAQSRFARHDSGRISSPRAMPVSSKPDSLPRARNTGNWNTEPRRCSFCSQPGCHGCNGSGPQGLPLTSEMPRNAGSGECYAQLYLPPEFQTVTERVCIREASERIEVIPAHYEWSEERILVKEATTELVEVPAQFDAQNQSFQTDPGHSTWIKADANHCRANTAGPAPQDIFCLVSEPPTQMTLQIQRLARPAEVKEVHKPAEYQTVRRQKLVRPASTRRVTVPAEYRDVQQTVMVVPARLEWKRVQCDAEATTHGRKLDSRVRQVKD